MQNAGQMNDIAVNEALGGSALLHVFASAEEYERCETPSTKVDSLLAHKLKTKTHFKVITKVLLFKSK